MIAIIKRSRNEDNKFTISSVSVLLAASHYQGISDKNTQAPEYRINREIYTPSTVGDVMLLHNKGKITM